MKTIHYIDYCSPAKIEEFIPGICNMMNVANYGMLDIKDTDVIIFEGSRVQYEDGTFGPHSVTKVCTVVHTPEGFDNKDRMLAVFMAVITYAHTYGATHNITPQMIALYGLTNNPYLKKIMEDK